MADHDGGRPILMSGTIFKIVPLIGRPPRYEISNSKI